MRKIVSCIDIGSSSIKLIVGEFVRDHLHILSAQTCESKGIDNGHIVDPKSLLECIKKVKEDTDNKLGVEIKKVILGLNLYNSKFTKSTGEIKIAREDNTINSDDITNVISKCASGKVDEYSTLVGVIPEYFGVNESTIVNDPKGIVSNILALKGIVVTAPKERVNEFLNITEDAGLKVVDIIPNIIGDYEAFKTPLKDSETGAVVNLGYETTTIGIVSKGVLSNMKVINVGVKNIINDIAYVKRIRIVDARNVYKTIGLASTRLANIKECMEATDIDNKTVEVNQYEISDIIESRIEDILNLVKKQINILTKKGISYIIISGGLSELKDIKLVIDNSMGKDAHIGDLNIIGARDNSYASAVGILKYFEKKVELRGKAFSALKDEDLESMAGGNDDEDKETDNSLLSRVFGYFFDS